MGCTCKMSKDKTSKTKRRFTKRRQDKTPLLQNVYYNKTSTITKCRQLQNVEFFFVTTKTSKLFNNNLMQEINFTVKGAGTLLYELYRYVQYAQKSQRNKKSHFSQTSVVDFTVPLNFFTRYTLCQC
jgi:hypothetical protein